MNKGMVAVVMRLMKTKPTQNYISFESRDAVP